MFRAHRSRPVNLEYRIAQRQHGVVLRSQLWEIGVSRATLQRDISAGRWEPHGKGVLCLAGTQQTPLVRAWITSLATRPEGILTGASAAALHGSGAWDDVPLGRQGWVLLNRETSIGVIALGHPNPKGLIKGGLALTTRTQTAIDLLRVLPLSKARTIAFRAVQLGDLNPESLASAIRELRGYRGNTQLRRILSDISDGAHAESERRALILLRRARITGWVANYRVELRGGAYAAIDIAFPEARLAIEIDGRAWHSSTDRFESDRTRQNSLVSANWRVLRFTWQQIVNDPDYVTTEIRRHLP